MPQQIGRYEIVTRLGVGGMARVYLGVQRGPFGVTKLVVIKQLRGEVVDDERFVSQFVDEARIALRLHHPNVVHTYDVVAEPIDYFMVMEFLEGHSLSSVLRRVGYTNIPLEQHIWVLTKVLAGLHYAHQLPDFDGAPLHIVHRDVSPSNVFVTYSGEVKLLDFGIAKATNALSSTQEGIVKGKVGYAAPEQLVGRAVDARSDLYSVGIMLWEAMARQRRWSSGTFHATLQARFENLDYPIEEVWPDVPASLATICRRALSPRPDDRQQTALELQTELEDYLACSGAAVAGPSMGAFMAAHFQEESVALRRNIANSLAPASLGPVALSPRSEPSPPPASEQPESEQPEMEKAVPRLSPARTSTLGVAAAVVVVFAAAMSHRMGPRRAHDSRLLPPSSAALGAPAASSWVPARTSAGSAAPSAPPPVIFEASVVTWMPPSASGSEQGHPTQPSDPASTTRRRHGGLVVQASAAEPMASLQEHAQGSERSEPGMDLRLRGTNHATRPLDEKDPYAR